MIGARVGRRERRFVEAVGVFADPPAPHVFQRHHKRELLPRDPRLVINEAVGVGQGDRSGAQLQQFFHRVLRDIAAARDQTHLALERLAACGQHLRREVHRAVAGRLWPDQRSSPVQSLPGENAGELVAQALVLPEEEADFASADTDVAGRHVGVGADVAVQLGHEALTEPHHLVVALPFRIEIGSTFAAAHRQRRQGVFEHLLEGEELEDAQVHRRMESQAAFVRADGAVHLDPVAAIDLVRAAIVLPRHAEHHHAFGLHHALDDPRAAILGTPLEDQIQRFDNFLHRLVKFGFARVLRSHFRHQVAHEARPLHVGRRHKDVFLQKRET